MSPALLFHYLMLNMFRMLIHPSSGACDLFVELFHGLCCSVLMEVYALACLFRGECLIVTCVVVYKACFCKYWLLRCLMVIEFSLCVVCFLIMCPEYILMSYI